MNILNIEHIHKIFGDKVIFDDISCGIDQGEKIGIIGVNGTGKTTLLRVIAGEEEPDEGQVITQNGIRISWLPQTPEFPQHMTILDYVAEGKWQKDWSTESEARRMLNTLGITDQNSNMDNLSGGEKKRVALARMLLNPADILILDEPTNHLDIASREWIEEAVEAFDGTLLFVSHDRYFINRFATRVWELAESTINDYPMGFAQYRAAKAEEKKPAPAPVQKKKQDTRPPRAGREKQAARRQLTICETGISKLEDRCRQLDREMEQYACDAEKLQELYREKQEVEAQLEQEMARWEELSLQLEE